MEVQLYAFLGIMMILALVDEVAMMIIMFVMAANGKRALMAVMALIALMCIFCFIGSKIYDCIYDLYCSRPPGGDPDVLASLLGS